MGSASTLMLQPLRRLCSRLRLLASIAVSNTGTNVVDNPFVLRVVGCRAFVRQSLVIAGHHSVVSAPGRGRYCPSASLSMSASSRRGWSTPISHRSPSEGSRRHSEAEAGQRGYLLTRQERFLAPYRSGVAKARKDLDIFQSLTADNHIQQLRVRQLRELVETRFKAIDATLNAATRPLWPIRRC